MAKYRIIHVIDGFSHYYLIHRKYHIRWTRFPFWGQFGSIFTTPENAKNWLIKQLQPKKPSRSIVEEFEL